MMGVLFPFSYAGWDIEKDAHNVLIHVQIM